MIGAVPFVDFTSFDSYYHFQYCYEDNITQFDRNRQLKNMENKLNEETQIQIREYSQDFENSSPVKSNNSEQDQYNISQELQQQNETLNFSVYSNMEIENQQQQYKLRQQISQQQLPYLQEQDDLLQISQFQHQQKQNQNFQEKQEFQHKSSFQVKCSQQYNICSQKQTIQNISKQQSLFTIERDNAQSKYSTSTSNSKIQLYNEYDQVYENNSQNQIKTTDFIDYDCSYTSCQDFYNHEENIKHFTKQIEINESQQLNSYSDGCEMSEYTGSTTINDTSSIPIFGYEQNKLKNQNTDILNEQINEFNQQPELIQQKKYETFQKHIIQNNITINQNLIQKEYQVVNIIKKPLKKQPNLFSYLSKKISKKNTSRPQKKNKQNNNDPSETKNIIQLVCGFFVTTLKQKLQDKLKHIVIHEKNGRSVKSLNNLILKIQNQLKPHELNYFKQICQDIIQCDYLKYCRNFKKYLSSHLILKYQMGFDLIIQYPGFFPSIKQAKDYYLQSYLNQQKGQNQYSINNQQILNYIQQS